MYVSGGMIPITLIIMPISLPILSTFAVFSSVCQWNSRFDSYIYGLTEEDPTAMQYLLYRRPNEYERPQDEIKQSSSVNHEALALTPTVIRMTVTIA